MCCEVFHKRHLLSLATFSALLMCGLVTTSSAEEGQVLSDWWVEPWTAPYAFSDWGGPSSIFLDPTTGEMAMTDPNKGVVRIFDPRGIERYQFRTTVVDERTRQLNRGEPVCALVLPSGNLYITDNRSHNVSIHNFRGDRIGELDVAAALNLPKGSVHAEKLALGPNNHIYVSTSGITGVLVFDQWDELVAKIAYDLEGYRRPEHPGALAVDDNGDVWIAELRGFPVIKHYSLDGTYLGGFGGRDVAARDFSFASAVLCAEDGTIWVADAIRQGVKHFTSDGEFIELIGGYGVKPGEMMYPTGLAGDGVTELYVCEREGRRIQRFYFADADGNPLIGGVQQ